MHLKQTALERQEDLFYSSSLSFQGDSASTSLASEMSQVCIALLPSQSSKSSGLETAAEKAWIWKCVFGLGSKGCHMRVERQTTLPQAIHSTDKQR